MTATEQIVPTREDSFTLSLISVIVNLLVFAASQSVYSLGLSLETIFLSPLTYILAFGNPISLLPFLPIILLIPLGYRLLKQTLRVRIVVSVSALIMQAMIILAMVFIHLDEDSRTTFETETYWLINIAIASTIGWLTAELAWLYFKKRD